MPVDHDPAARRFTMAIDGHEAELDYQLQDGWMVITHTGVPAPIEDRGVASALTRAAFEHASVQGWNVRPDCPYAAGWVERHPEYQPLLG